MNKTAVITGGATGIGFATAKILAAKKYNVIIACRNIENLKKAKKEIKEIDQNNKIEFQQCDVAKINDIKNLFKFSLEKFNQIDCLINAAAVLDKELFINLNINNWQKLIDINLKGTVLSCHEAFKYMKNKGGNIINISSYGAILNTDKFPGLSSYITSKFAINGLTEALAVEGRNLNIRVNAIAPGAVDTNMLKKAAPNLKTSTKPHDIAKTICYIISNDAKHINGSIIIINSNE